MKKLSISAKLTLPLDVVTSTLIVYGGKGMGKTVFGAVLAEELSAAHQRWAWLDPLGVGWGIRHSADGNGKGVECLILGGVHGDIPIDPGGGAAVADVVVEESVNVLIDFSRKPSGEMWGVGEKIRFVTAYAKRLFQRQGDLIGGRRREPLFQLLDEGARYIPQIIPAGNPDLSLCVAAWQQFAEEGRNVGLGLCVLTQRSARVNKDVAELADAMVAFRTIGPNSLGAVLDWLGEHVERSRVKALSEEVRKLPRGSALIVSPGWLELEKVVPIRMRHTFDSSATPKSGERPRTARGEGAKPNLEKIRARMAQTIEKAKQDDPKALRARIAELEKELTKKIVPTKTPKIEAYEVVVDGRDLKEIIEAVEEFEKGCAAFEKPLRALRVTAGVAGGSVRRARQTGLAALAKRLAKTALTLPQPGQQQPRVLRQQMDAMFEEIRPKAPHPQSANAPNAFDRVQSKKLPKGERAVLIAIAQHPDGVTRPQLTALTGYKRSSRDAYVSRLSGAGFLEAGHTGRVVATAAGVEALGQNYEPLPTGLALLEHWLTRLPEGERRILEFVAANAPHPLERAKIDEYTGYKRSSRDAYINRLTARELVKIAPEGVALANTLK